MSESASSGDLIIGLILLGIALVLYLIPTWVAKGREHHNFAAISVLNLLLGWTFLGWVAALVWSLTAVNKQNTKQEKNRKKLGY